MTRHNDDGSAVLEIVLLAPVLILMLAAVIGGAPVTLAHQHVDAAAAQAARAASTAASPSAASAVARSTARSAISNGRDCLSMTVSVDVSDFRPGGSVTVRVSCAADLGTGVPGLSGRRTITGSGSEVIDTFRQVSG